MNKHLINQRITKLERALIMLNNAETCFNYGHLYRAETLLIHALKTMKIKQSDSILMHLLKAIKIKRSY